jgi:hypothetical protein
MDGGSLDEDYVTALVDTALTIQDQAESMEDGIGLSNQALDLLRALANDSPEKWMISLVSAIEVQLERFGWMLDNDEELALLEELDGFLAGTPTIAARLKRVRYRRRVARVLLTDENIEAAMQTVGEIQLLVKSVGLDAPNLALDQLEAVQAAEADISLLRGDAQRTKRNLAQASKEYQAGLDGLMHLDISTTRNDLSRLRSDLHFRLSETPPPNAPASVAAEHAIQAIKYGAGLNLSVMRFTKLARSIIEVPDRPDLALSFCESALDTPDRRAKPVVANYYGRTPRGAEDFLSIVAALCKIIAPLDSDQSRSMLALLFENSELVIKNLLRRRKTVGSKQFGNIGALIAQITHILESAQLSIERSSEWEEALKVFAPTRSRAPLSTDRE